MTGNDLGGTRGAVLEAHQAPAFAAGGVEADVAGVVEQVELSAGKLRMPVPVGGQDETLVEPEAPAQDHDVPAPLLDRHVEIELDVLRLAAGEEGESLHRDVDLLARLVAVRVQDDEGVVELREVPEDLSDGDLLRGREDEQGRFLHLIPRRGTGGAIGQRLTSGTLVVASCLGTLVLCSPH